MPLKEKYSDLTSYPLKRIALCLQYQGTNFSGWQKQKNSLTIQSVLENAIFELDPSGIHKTVAAGRTDAGVHAAAQVVHFDYAGPIPSERWAAALNGRLPKAIRVIESVEQQLSWHACYSAIYRRYRYMIYNSRKPNLFLSPWVWHKYQIRLDQALMALAVKRMVGFYEFSAFRKAGSNRSNSFTTIQEVQLERQGDIIFLEIQATGFLYGMVRLLVGQLVALGEHRINLVTFENRWKEGRRVEVKESAPASGLCFLRAGYKKSLFSSPAAYQGMPKFNLDFQDTPPHI